jgi:hypothetical protein
VAGKSPVNHENIMGKSMENDGKSPKKTWKNMEKHGKSWENPWKMKVLMENNIYT